MSSSSRPPSKLLDLDITIISAKHLKNVNWRHGDLKPYVSFWLEPSRRFTTKPDDSLSTRPVWNERFIIPINFSLQDTLLTIDINHFETPNLLVGSVEFPLKTLVNSDDSNPIRNLELRRPSGRPQGKIRVKLNLRERERPSPPVPDYQFTPQPNYYYSSAPPPPTRDYRSYSAPQYASHIPPAAPTLPPPPSPYPYGGYTDPYPPYYSGYYSHPPPPPSPSPSRPFVEQGSSYGSGPSGPSVGPSAPVDYSIYDHKAKGNKMGLGTGLAVGAVAGALGGLALDQGLKYEEDKIADRVENDMAARDDYSDYRANY